MFLRLDEFGNSKRCLPFGSLRSLRAGSQCGGYAAIKWMQRHVAARHDKMAKRSLGTLPQRKEEKHDREPCQHRGHNESGGRKFRAMMETHFHLRGQTEQEKKQRDINQNYADPLFVVGFHQ